MEREEALEALRKATGLSTPAGDVWLAAILHALDVDGITLARSVCPDCDRWIEPRCPEHGAITTPTR